MPREVPDTTRRLDPRRHLEADPLVARMLDEPSPDARADAAHHIQARDPRARLDAAAAQLHGGRSDLPFPASEDVQPDAARKRREL